MHKIFFNMFFLFLLIGCSENTTDPAGDLTAMTDDTYYAGISKIIVTIKNDTKSTVYFSHCDYRFAYYIEKKDSDSWLDNGNVGIICQAVYPDGRISLASMSSIKDTIIFSHSTGIYRLIYPYSFQQNGDLSNLLITNEFNNYNPR